MSSGGIHELVQEVNVLKEDVKLLLEKINNLKEDSYVDRVTRGRSDNKVSPAHVTRLRKLSICPSSPSETYILPWMTRLSMLSWMESTTSSPQPSS